jgi:hypothetical protein
MERAEIKDFTSTFTFNDDGTFSYTSDLLLKPAGVPGNAKLPVDVVELALSRSRCSGGSA